MMVLKEQKPDEIVDVGPILSHYYEVYPEGAREKVSFIWPDKPEQPYSFCIPSRLYMFKLSRATYPEQFWVEIFAYQLGCLINVPVPPAFVAYDSENSKAGALIEWFYNQDVDLYQRGGDAMQASIPGYDTKKGKLHNLQSIFSFIQPLKWGRVPWIKEWAKILIFDALIGNTDRHHDNWGIITQFGSLNEAERKRKSKEKTYVNKMSPAFDNGTSMGIEILEKNFDKFKQLGYLENYVSQGKPHLKWDLTEDREKRCNHKDFITRFIDEYPECKEEMKSCLQFTKPQLEEILERLKCFNINPRLSKNRAQFMQDLLLYRKEQLLLALGD